MGEPEPLDLEKLRKKIVNMVDYWNEDTSLMRNEGVEAIIRKIKHHIKVACEFYLKYKDKPALFSDEQFTIRWGYDRGTGTYILDLGNDYTEYNEWLFKEAFKCVLEEKNE